MAPIEPILCALLVFTACAAVLPADAPPAVWTGRTFRPASALGGGAASLGAILPSEVAFDWEGTSVTLRVDSATSLSVSARLAPNLTLALRVAVDALPPSRIYVTGAATQRAGEVPPLASYALAESLEPTSAHTITVTSAVEPLHIYANVPPTAILAPPAFASFVTDGIFLQSPQPPTARTLLFIGDSISAGSGSIGTPPCHGDIHTTDVTVAYSALLAANFSSQLLGVIAVSGAGVLVDTMTTRVHGTIGLRATEDHDWNSPTRPTAIVVNLGTNDFLGRNASNETFVAEFVDAYTAFVIDLAMNRLSNGSTFFLIVGPISDAHGPAVDQVVSRCRTAGVPTHVVNVMGAVLDGCDVHPGTRGHAQMASLVQPVIAGVMGWGMEADLAASPIIAAERVSTELFHSVSARTRATQDRRVRAVPGPAVNLTVRSDGSGDFLSVGAALASCNASGDPSLLGHVTLHLLGVFFERFEVSVLFPSGVTLIGDGRTPDDALIIFNRGGLEGYSTWWAHTVSVGAADVTFVNVAIANNASDYDSTIAGQAPALHLRVTADRFACFECALYGAQDTLYTGGAGYGIRSYFAGGFINGSTDSLFGGSSTVFEGVSLNMSNCVTAPRGEPSSAYLFLDCDITGAGTLLGRPWGQLSSVIFINTSMSAAVEPAGWNDWEHGCTAGHSGWCRDLTFAEFASHGPGASSRKRVAWSLQLDPAEAAAWNKSRVLRGWAPARSRTRSP